MKPGESISLFLRTESGEIAINPRDFVCYTRHLFDSFWKRWWNNEEVLKVAHKFLAFCEHRMISQKHEGKKTETFCSHLQYADMKNVIPDYREETKG